MFIDGASKFSTAVVAADGEMTEPEQATRNPLDDVFGEDSDDHHSARDQLSNRTANVRASADDVSDVPRLRGIHTTNGYRDGISASKESHLQEGFDEGYSLGAEIGAMSGRLIGALEALVNAVNDQSAKVRIAAKIEEARTDLSAKNLYAPAYFGEDGIWKFEVGDINGGEEDVTFRVVASKHPVIMKWNLIVDGILHDHGLKPTFS